MARWLLILGGINALLAVALGAFAAHGLKGLLDPGQLATFRTGVHYQTWHALGLILIGLVSERRPGVRMLWRAGSLILAGIVLFSGSLYLLALTGVPMIGAITPVGGLALLLGWLLFVVAIWKDK